MLGNAKKGMTARSTAARRFWNIWEYFEKQLYLGNEKTNSFVFKVEKPPSLSPSDSIIDS